MSPPAVLLEQLAEARRAGRTFDESWPMAVGAAVRAAQRLERQEWAQVLGSMADAWRAAWERRPPTAGELAAASLDSLRGRGEPLPDRECRRCGGGIPDTRGRRCTALYCSDRCRREAAEKRRWVAA
jgi:hypothetical protein